MDIYLRKCGLLLVYVTSACLCARGGHAYVAPAVGEGGMGAGGQFDACCQQRRARRLPRSYSKVITSGTPFADGSLGPRICTLALNLGSYLLLPRSGFSKTLVIKIAIERKDSY